MADRVVHARTALEEVCARGDLERARERYAGGCTNHVNALELRGQEGDRAIRRDVPGFRGHDQPL